jgi:Na+-transporting methylmalonyl-CoA/oxaloacetate decarboxylase gamma subunit
MFDTLVELGGSVLNGGLSTLLGVLVMAFSKSTAFTTLFQMFFSMVVFGLAHGLIFLPCLIYLISLAARVRTSIMAPPMPMPREVQETVATAVPNSHLIPRL